MIHIRDTGDDNSSATTESRKFFGIFYKLDLEMFMPGSWEF